LTRARTPTLYLGGVSPSSLVFDATEERQTGVWPRRHDCGTFRAAGWWIAQLRAGLPRQGGIGRAVPTL